MDRFCVVLSGVVQETQFHAREHEHDYAEEEEELATIRAKYQKRQRMRSAMRAVGKRRAEPLECYESESSLHGAGFCFGDWGNSLTAASVVVAVEECAVAVYTRADQLAYEGIVNTQRTIK